MTAHVHSMDTIAGPGPLAYCWIDLETCGLNPDDPLLELAVIATDSDLREITSFTTIVRPQPDTFDRIAAVPAVQAMHERNGLLDELRNHGHNAPTEQQVENMLLALLDKYEDPDASPVQIAGGGVSHFDHPYLKHRMPRFTGRLSYRPMDITQSSQAYTAATKSHRFGEKGANKAHRAEADIREDLARAREFWDMYRKIDALYSPGEQPPLEARDAVLAGVQIIAAFAASQGPDFTGAATDMRTILGTMRDSDAIAGVTAVAAYLAASLAGASGMSMDTLLQGVRRTLASRAAQNVLAPRM